MEPILYILMRDDIDSMNPGKAIAQGCHAANAFESHARAHDTEYSESFATWKNQTAQGFGTTITLSGNMSKIENDVYYLKQLGFIADVIHDPTYPLRDGFVTHVIPLNTCAYVFAPDKDDNTIRTFLSRYPLHL